MNTHEYPAAINQAEPAEQSCQASDSHSSQDIPHQVADAGLSDVDTYSPVRKTTTSRSFIPRQQSHLLALYPSAMCPYLAGKGALNYRGLRTPICYYTEHCEEVIYDPQYNSPERSYLSGLMQPSAETAAVYGNVQQNGLYGGGRRHTEISGGDSNHWFNDGERGNHDRNNRGTGQYGYHRGTGRGGYRGGQRWGSGSGSWTDRASFNYRRHTGQTETSHYAVAFGMHHQARDADQTDGTFCDMKD